ncbi:uncharacterized protein LOC143289232 isoform X3 [Babylonia areolata]|uniref:uncharacterized protein LOC143289232 isoform X3 n=1 Tax=Babylonia areolata TaxID=304850 RepID=UPI003FD10C96
MGRYSDSDEDSSRKLKKKKKRRSRSRSRSAESSSSRYSHSHKHKKSKKKHRQRSRSYSRSPERHSRRDRSPPRRRRSRSPDRSRRSRSSDRGRRSRSYERKRRSSRDRRSRSDSRDRVSSRRRSTSRERSRRSRSDSGSRSQYDSRRSSAERKKGRRGSTSPTPHAVSTSESNALDEIPGFKDMTPAEQAQMRLKMALRAATMSDEKLKEQSPSSAQGAPVSSPLSRQQFAEAVATIDADSFVPTSFKSSRSSKSLKETREAATELPSHNMAMFGAVGNSVVFTKAEPVDKSSEALEDNPETLFADCLKVDPEEKMARWIQKLTALRRKRLEGEAIDSY